ncbi:MAG: RNA-binding S4 domain-containing protein, partial [Thermoleophilaceae bacterium]
MKGPLRHAPAALESLERQRRSMARELLIRGEMVRLGQLLKLAGIVDGGGEVKTFLADHEVLVNGEPEARRGRQLRPGDVVRVADEEL